MTREKTYLILLVMRLTIVEKFHFEMVVEVPLLVEVFTREWVFQISKMSIIPSSFAKMILLSSKIEIALDDFLPSGLILLMIELFGEYNAVFLDFNQLSSDFESNSSKSKQICQFYINGACKKGDKCPYSHDAEQIHKKELCKFFLSGKCNKGDKCLYSHDLKEIPCKFIHGLGFCENFQN